MQLFKRNEMFEEKIDEIVNEMIVVVVQIMLMKYSYSFWLLLLFTVNSIQLFH